MGKKNKNYNINITHDKKPKQSWEVKALNFVKQLSNNGDISAYSAEHYTIDIAHRGLRKDIYPIMQALYNSYKAGILGNYAFTTEIGNLINGALK